MRKVILSLACSLDGYIEGPNGEIDWISFTEETGNTLNEFLKELDTVFYGRVSYEAWGTYSPPEATSPGEKEFYENFSRLQPYVFSRTKKTFAGDPIVVDSNIEQLVKDLKQREGKNIWLYGGADLAKSFANLNLIDEFRLAILPIILGKGKSLYQDIQHRIPLKLLKVQHSASGMVELNYERVL